MDVVVALKKLYQLQYNKHGYQPIIKLIRLKVLEKEDGFDKKQKFRRIPIADIFKGKYWKMPIRKVLVEGDAGIGKTTLCNIVSEGWANGKLYQQFDLLLHLPLRNKELISAASFSELLRKLSPSTAVSDSVKMGKEKILVVADGWEELAEALQSKKSFLYRLLFGDIPSVSVILTSRRNSFHSYGYFDRFVELCGFNEESIDMYVQSRFSSDQEKANLLLNKLKCLPLVKSLCSIPLNCAMICNLWQYHPGEAFHTNITVTELYAKSVLISILKNMQKSGNYVTFSEIADLDALPEGIQHRFLLLCKLAFVAITNCQVVFTHQDLINFFPRVETGDILPFGLVQLNDSISYGETYSFPHLSLQEYLATLYIVKQPISMNEQLKLLMKLNHRGMMIWRFYSGIVFGRREPIENLSQIQSNIIEMNVLPYTSSLEAKSLHNLSHFALEANNKEFDNGVNQYITNECYVCHLASAYDCAAMLYIITVIDNCEVVITSCNSGIRADQVLTLADNLANKCGSIQIKELYLAHDKLSDECLSYFFHQGISAFKALEKLCLSGNSIKTRGMTSIMSLMDICSGTLTQLDLSHNILDILEIQMLTDIVGRLSKLQELFLKRSLSHDADLDLLYLPKLLRTILSNCHDFSKLDMSDNNLGSPGLSTLFRSNVFGWQNIHLAMNDNKIDDNFLESLDGFHLPRRLELRENSIHESGLCFLAYGVRTGKLLMHESTELFLDSNPLDLKGALAISKTLSTSCCLLSRLSLSNCNLTTVGDSFLHSEKFSSQVVEGIGRQLHHMAQNDTLIWLNLDDNNFTGQGIHILIGFLHLCPRLKWLSTNSCGITSDDFIELIVKLSGYKSSSTHTKICEELQSWYLGNNKIDSYALSIVLDQLPSLFPSIQVCDGFYLHDNPISISMMEHLQIKLKNCKDEHSVASQWTEPHEDSGILVDKHEINKKLLVVGVEGDYVHEDRVDPLLLRLQRYESRTTTDFRELDFLLSLCSAQIIAVEGHAGAGKTSLLEYLCQNSLNEFELILYVHLQQCGKNMQTFQDLAMELDTTESQLCNDIERAETRTLVILDGLDMLVQKESWSSTVFAHILFRKSFPLSSIVVCSRPSGLQHVDCIYINHHFQLNGLSISHPNNKLNPLKFQEHWILIMYEQHPVILKLCEIPLIAELVCQFLGQGNANVTLTDVLIYTVVEVMKREMKKQGHETRSNLQLLILPEDIKGDFENICKLAFESLVCKNLLTNSDEVNMFLSAFHLNNSFAINESDCFGLVEEVSHGHIEFLHPLIQEFLAGYYLYMQPPLDQLVMIHQYISKVVCQSDSTEYLLPFFFGLTWRKNSEFDLNPTKLMFHTLIEFLASCFEVEECDRSIHNLMFILCIAETGDNELWKKLVTKLGSDLCLWLSLEDIKKHKWTIATMVSCSQIQEWNINASNFSVSDELELYMGVRVNKIEVPSMDRSVITFSPRMGIEAASKKQTGAELFSQYPDKIAAMMNHYQCRAVREILQRAFAMFAEKIRLKGDSSNPAYVSFLSCGCFQDNLENNLRFSPYLPFHFLQVTSKRTLKKLQEEHGVHLAAKHGGKAVELVILLKPCMRRITFIHKSREHCIVIMSEKLAQSPISKGAIACMVANIKSTTTEALVTCSDDSFSSNKSEMVRPNLPLPSKIEENTRTATVLPQVVTSNISHVPISHSIVHGVPQQEEPQAQQELLQRESPNDNVEKANGASPGSGSPLMHHFPPPTLHHQSLLTATPTPTQQTVHSRSNIKPGAVLFTSVPRQIPADLIHPLPDETHQLRRGGNGQIFRGTVGGMNVVYKKTNYRSREYSIIVKLNHRNVVQLLAFMYGEENPAHKRRHYCYHIMPQLSGDCARMLTDKRELTIKELHKKHANNIRKMGTIRGNLKFLLKEILHGLRYLHSLRIAHRDIKGSNILLKFHCACTNPLECGCDTKYQVQLCDFDAAIEFDENERLPHTSTGSKASFQTSALHYVCIPVGTNGFRSPECSMLVISNSPDCFSPTITTRCDIWSLGVLTIRMLIGASGPSTQRDMALLLLYHHRQRYMHEGLHKDGYLVVDKIVTDKLLNVPQLIKEVGWLKGAVRFVECCVAVDPLTRYSAEALLQHDFLY